MVNKPNEVPNPEFQPPAPSPNDTEQHIERKRCLSIICNWNTTKGAWKGIPMSQESIQRHIISNIVRGTIIAAFALLLTVASGLAFFPRGDMIAPVEGVIFGQNAIYSLTGTGLKIDQVYNMPSSSANFFISYDYNSSTPPTSTSDDNIRQVLVAYGSTTYSSSMSVFHTLYTPIGQSTAHPALEFVATNHTSEHFYSTSCVSTTAIPYDGDTQNVVNARWHNIELTVNLQDTRGAPYTVDATIDGSTTHMGFDCDGTGVNGAPEAFDLDWSTVNNFALTSSGDNGTGGSHNPFRGDFAEFYMQTRYGQSISSTTTQKFWNSNNTAPSLGTSCEEPLGFVPQMCNRGGSYFFREGPAVSGVIQYIMHPTGGYPLPSLSDPCAIPSQYGAGCL